MHDELNPASRIELISNALTARAAQTLYVLRWDQILNSDSSLNTR